MATTAYCTNIHPGESWREIFRAVRRHVPAVKRRVSPHAPFPLGLRLSGRAAREMSASDADEFYGWCRENNVYVATINAFPFGTFHHTAVKESVYLPDWRYTQRLTYTQQAADLLDRWLPDKMTGSISTVPGGFRGSLREEDFPEIKKHLVAALDYLEALRQKSGREILLSLEPEPGCLLETTADVLAFFDRLALSPVARSLLAVCYDCCHQALQYEDPAESLRQLAAHDIRIGHVQVSSALRLNHPDIGRLSRFCESCYLHQTVGRTKAGELLRFADLDQAIAASPENMEEWRVHFHVPVFLGATRECATTRFFLDQILPLFPEETPMEVETYTWAVLPAELRCERVTDSISREIEWVEAARKHPMKDGAVKACTGD